MLSVVAFSKTALLFLKNIIGFCQFPKDWTPGRLVLGIFLVISFLLVICHYKTNEKAKALRQGKKQKTNKMFAFRDNSLFLVRA